MTVEDVEMKEEGAEDMAPPPPFPNISILQLVKDAQQQHGLRHGDYNRYRIYCKDKLRRVRSALKVTNPHKCVKRHRAKFAQRPIGEESFVDQRYLQIPLFEVERRWAQAMNDKMALEDNPQSRKRHSMRSALKRAVQHAVTLEGLIKTSPRCDASTKLEAQAYCLWLKGIVAFELREWSTASENLKAAKVVYERLADATPNSTLSNLYKGKCRDIQPQLRLCEFNSNEAPKASMSELLLIKEQMVGDSAEIDHLISEMRSKAKTEDTIPVEWAGVVAPAGDEKVRSVIEAWEQTDKELKECSEPKQRMALLEKQIADTRDAIERLSEGQKRKVAEGSTGLDTEEAARLRGYLDFVRLSRTAQRYLAIIENTKLEKKYKPQDLLRLYDSVIEILKEVMELPGAENKDLQEAYAARIEYYKTFRCYYMACAYSSLVRFDEAVALFGRVQQRLQNATQLLKKIGKNKYLPETAEPLTALKGELDRAMVTAKAERLAKAAAGMDVDQGKKADHLDNRPILETLEEWREWLLPAAGAATASAVGKRKGRQDKDSDHPVVPIASFPPSLLPMPVKPMYFDLALGHVRMPNLEQRLSALVEQEPTTTTPSKGKGGAAKGGKTSTTEQQQQSSSSQDQPGWKGWFWGKK